MWKGLEMKNLSKKIVLCMLLSIMALSLISCGGPKTLEEAVQSSEESKGVIDQLNETPGMKVVVKENVMSMTYTFEDDLSVIPTDELNSTMEEAMSGVEPELKAALASLYDETGIKGIQIKLLCIDKNGLEVYSKTIE